MKSLKVGVVGIGGQGKTHLFNSLRLKTVEVKAIADSSKSVLSRYSSLKINKYTDFHEMFRKEPLDAVIIAVPNFLHEEVATVAAEHGLDILIEKPLARTAEESKRIVDSVNRNGVSLMVGMCQRFSKDAQMLKEKIDNGVFGRVDFASVLFSTGPFYDGKRVPDWLFDSTKIGGGALLDSGCHLIDLLLWYFGDVKSVSGYVDSIFNLGYEDYAEASLRFKNGTNGLAVVSWRPRFPSFRIEIVGEYGRSVGFSKTFGLFDVGLRKAALSFFGDNLSQKLRGGSFLPIGDEFYRMLDYFVLCSLKGEEPKPNAEDFLKVSEVIDLVYKQNRNSA